MPDLGLLIRILFFDILSALAIAKLEIEVEGKYGWAENLPTWKIFNKWTKLFWGEKPYTGYHLWLTISTLVFLHLPFFAFPWVWTINLELFLLGNFLLAVLFEDFFWFLLNPHYGLTKFTKTHAHWHDSWIGPIPTLYLKLLIPAAVMIYLTVAIATHCTSIPFFRYL